MENCTFHNNTSSGYFTSKPYQGSSGGLSIGYNSSNVGFINPQPKIQHSYAPPPSLSILIINCTFTSNSATLLHGQRGTSTNLLIKKTFPGHGGAFSILANTDTVIDFVFSNSRVINNFAETFGGGVYCLTLRGSQQQYTFGNNVFMNNTASVAGGLALIYLVNTILEFPVHTLVCNCTFYNNTATSVAGATAVYFIFGFASDVFVIFEECKFSSNTAVLYGGAVDITSYNFFDNIQAASLIEFIDWLV